MKILIAEDDDFTRKGLADIFTDEGFDVLSAEDGNKVLELFDKHNPDIVCLDIMMPGKNGYDVCKKIRQQDQQVPVLFLSAKSEEIDKVLGLELGADDYISKPFGVREIVARVRALLRRTAMGGDTAEGQFDLGDLSIFPQELRAVRGETIIDLTARDIKMLELFYRQRGNVLDRDSLYNAGWGVTHMPNSRTLDQHISQLRKKIEKDPKNPQIIITVHTAGYRCPK